MKIRTFIERPVLSTVISIIFILGGIIGLLSLPIERYPNIAPPTINVQTTYTGASAETVQKSVIAPLEEAINGVENMTYMTSTATNNGSANVRVFFKQGTNPDMAAVNVQNCVARATRSLPTEVNDFGVTVKKRQTSILEHVALYSPNDTYDRAFIANYAKINLLPQILRIPGVGDAEVRGSDYSMRIWLKPDVMAQYHLIPSDVQKALGEQNIEAATGSFGENADQTFQYTMKYSGRLERPDQFENIVIRALPSGEILRLKDVARIELGTQTYQYIGRVNGHPGTEFSVYQTPGSNATEVINRIDAFLEEARKDFPADLELAVLASSNDFLYASIDNVAHTLIEAIILVTLVVFVFLRSWRSTMIPLICTIVSIIGTFMFLYLFNFSINLLTLFALVLSIGVVVDDAIIVVEAVHARFDAGYRSSHTAAIDAMENITSAIITSTLVFMAVFIPVSLMGGTSGAFYTQFGVTMAVSVGISAVNALTLSPALCALFLKAGDSDEAKLGFIRRLGMAFEVSFARMTRRYLGSVCWFIRHRWISALVLVVAVSTLAYLMNTVKTGLIPSEDVGTVRVDVTAPAGSSLAHTREIMDRIDEEMIQHVEECRAYVNMTGFGMTTGAGSSYGNFSLRLKPWDERPGREHSVDRIVERIKDYAASFTDASIFCSSPAMIPGYGATNGFEVFLLDKADGSVDSRVKIANEFVAALKERPEIGSCNTSFKADFPQYVLDVDAVKCKRAGITPNDVLSVLHGYYGGILSTKFNRFTKLYQVVVQADPQYRVDMETMKNVFVRTGTDMAPVGQFVRLRKVYGPQSLTRMNMFPCANINGKAAEGYSSGDAIRAVREVAEEVLPVGYGFDFGGLSREEAMSENNTLYIFIVCILLIYLILCALYESFFVPFAVILSVPAGLMGSFLFADMMGLENNIYLQTGLIMLIGLLSKTAILITEYADEHRLRGETLARSAFYAAKDRFRPIMMTVLTMVFGMLPLMFSTGVGANGNNTLGSGVVGGMVVGTIALLFLVPALFVVFKSLEERILGVKKEESDENTK